MLPAPPSSDLPNPSLPLESLETHRRRLYVLLLSVFPPASPSTAEFLGFAAHRLDVLIIIFLNVDGLAMEENREFSLAVRAIQGLDYGNSYSASSGSTAWIGKGFSCVCAQRRETDARISFELTPMQEVCLQRLQSRIDVTYDCSKLEHQEALRSLWHAAFPDVELHGLVSEQWKEMGWQGKDPSTDFRGGGFISLENLLFFSRTFPKTFHDLLWKREGNRSLWEYPFAVAGVNITFMLIQMLDLQSAKPRTMMGAVFLKMLTEEKRAFDLLYCVTFKLLDHHWLAMQASYMDFNAVMKATRRQLECELLLEDVQRLDDMPSFRLLVR